MNRKTKDKLLFIIGLGTAFFAMQAAVDLEYKYSENMSNRNRLYEQVCTKADANRDKYLTTDEWKSACKAMGIQYTPNLSIFSFSEDQMLRYLAFSEEEIKHLASK